MSTSIAFPEAGLSPQPDDGLAPRRARAELRHEISVALAGAGRDPLTTIARDCPACGADHPLRAPFLRAPVYDFHRCGSCSLAYTSRLVTPEVLRTRVIDSALGRADFQLAREESATIDPESYATILDRVLDHAPSRGTAIDVGAAFGAMAAALRPRFDETIALEPDSRVAEVAARRHDLPVRPLRLDELVRAHASVDAITFHGTLERAADPGALLAAARRLLKPGGAIYVGVTHEASLGLGLLGSGHPAVATHRLVNLWNEASLCTLAAEHGFVIRSLVESDELDVSIADWALARLPEAAGIGAALDRLAAAAARRWHLPSRKHRGSRLELVATKGAEC